MIFFYDDNINFFVKMFLAYPLVHWTWWSIFQHFNKKDIPNIIEGDNESISDGTDDDSTNDSDETRRLSELDDLDIFNIHDDMQYGGNIEEYGIDEDEMSDEVEEASDDDEVEIEELE